MVIYLAGLVIGYGSGFAISTLGYKLFKNNPKIN
jgi:hypothetical protein